MSSEYTRGGSTKLRTQTAREANLRCLRGNYEMFTTKPLGAKTYHLAFEFDSGDEKERRKSMVELHV